MTMAPFFTRFPQLAVQETRLVTLQQSREIPDGEYAFFEWYCIDRACDCRRVLVEVMASTTGDQVWATINYGWESPVYYMQWVGGRELARTMLARGMAGATLEPLGVQGPYASAFLQLFEQAVGDAEYIQCLQRHYQLFKGVPTPSKSLPRRGKRRSRR